MTPLLQIAIGAFLVAGIGYLGTVVVLETARGRRFEEFMAGAIRRRPYEGPAEDIISDEDVRDHLKHDPTVVTVNGWATTPESLERFRAEEEADHEARRAEIAAELEAAWRDEEQ